MFSPSGEDTKNATNTTAAYTTTPDRNDLYRRGSNQTNTPLSDKSHTNAKAEKGYEPAPGNISDRTTIGDKAEAATTPAMSLLFGSPMPHPTAPMPRNSPARGLASGHAIAHNTPSVTRRCCNAKTAANATAIPNAKVTRPTTRFVTVPAANHNDPIRDAGAIARCTIRSNSTAETTPLNAPSSSG